MGILSTVLGGAISAAQQAAQNNFNRQEAQKARDFEERMSNTSYQRQVADMQAAGLNPALMYGGAGSSGASTPSGNPASAAGNFDAVQSMLAMKQIELVDAQKEKTLNEADLISRESAWKDRLNDATLRETESRIGVNQAEINSREYDNALKQAETLLKRKEFQWFDQTRTSENSLRDAQTAYHKAEAAISAMEAQMGHRLSSSELLALTDSLLALVGGKNPLATAAGNSVVKAVRRATTSRGRRTATASEYAGYGGRAATYPGRKSFGRVPGQSRTRYGRSPAGGR